MDKCAACRVGAAHNWLEVRLEHRVREGWSPPEVVYSGPVCDNCEGQLLALERALWPAERLSTRGDWCDFCSTPLANESWVVESQATAETASPARQVRMCFVCLDLLHEALAGAIRFGGPWEKFAAARRTATMPPARARARALITSVEDGPVCEPLPSCAPPVPVRIDPALAAEAGAGELQVLARAMSAYGRQWLRADPDGSSSMHRVAFEMPGTGHRYESCIARVHCPECGSNSFFSRDIGYRQPVPGQLTDLARALREANARAQWAVTHDGVTGLYTRGAWLAEAARGVGDIVALFTIDRFPELTAAIGYAAADSVMQQAASLLDAALGASVLAGRFSEGALAALLRQPQATAVTVAEAAAARVAENVKAAAAGNPAVTVSGAVAALRGDPRLERAARLEEACQEAESALAGGPANERVTIISGTGAASTEASPRAPTSEQARAA